MRRIALLAVLALAACGYFDTMAVYRYAGPPALPTAGGQKPASAAEIEKAVTGNTLVAITREGGRWVRYFRPGGYVTAYNFPEKPPAAGRQWTFVRGVWRASDGQLCFRGEESRQEDCMKIIAGPGVLHAYSEKDNLWQFSAELRPGNPFDL